VKRITYKDIEIIGSLGKKSSWHVHLKDSSEGVSFNDLDIISKNRIRIWVSLQDKNKLDSIKYLLSNFIFCCE